MRRQPSTLLALTLVSTLLGAGCDEVGDANDEAARATDVREQQDAVEPSAGLETSEERGVARGEGLQQAAQPAFRIGDPRAGQPTAREIARREDIRHEGDFRQRRKSAEKPETVRVSARDSEDRESWADVVIERHERRTAAERQPQRRELRRLQRDDEETAREQALQARMVLAGPPLFDPSSAFFPLSRDLPRVSPQSFQNRPRVEPGEDTAVTTGPDTPTFQTRTPAGNVAPEGVDPNRSLVDRPVPSADTVLDDTVQPNESLVDRPVPGADAPVGSAPQPNDSLVNRPVPSADTVINNPVQPNQGPAVPQTGPSPQ